MGDHTKMWSTSKRRVWNVISFLKRTFMHDVIDHTVWVGKWVCSLLLGAFVLFSLLVFWEYGIFDPAGHIAKDTLVRLQRFCEIFGTHCPTHLLLDLPTGPLFDRQVR